jgi:Fe-S cluster assembly protein SufD
MTSSFFDTAARSLEGLPNEASRRLLLEAVVAQGLPTTADEVWRYAPLTDLDLDRYAGSDGVVPTASDLSRALAAECAAVVEVVDGRLGAVHTIDGLDVDAVHEVLAGREDPLEALAGDAFALLNAALSPATVRLRVREGATLDGPVLVHLRSGAPATFPRLLVELGARSRATVIELHEGAHDGLVVPLAQYRVGAGAHLDLATYQRYDLSAWHVARTLARVEADAVLRQAVIGLGGHYDRARNDAILAGTAAQNELRTTFLGVGDQVHDLRSHQYHLGARSRATLLSKGAVADTSRSVYTGLIEIEKGAKRTDARQTNHNLLLSGRAHADSVPNLDIRENDVMCAHASSVGPLDLMQRWYLESRGVESEVAERLMIQGFFNEMLDALPGPLAGRVEADVAERLSAVAVVGS